jgi:hypothetical protein
LAVNWAMVCNLSDTEHKRMDSYNLSRANLWDSISQIIFQRLALSCYLN